MTSIPQIPTMLYDGDCGFCARAIAQWRRHTGDMVRYVPYQSALREFPQVSEAHCRVAVQLIMPDGRVFSGAHAVLKAWSLVGRHTALLRLYGGIPLFRICAEGIYQFIAHRRSWWSRLFNFDQCKR